jgi:hypothetical protein
MGLSEGSTQNFEKYFGTTNQVYFGHKMQEEENICMEATCQN